MCEQCCRCGWFPSSATLCSLVGVSTYNGGKSETTNTSFYILDAVHPNEKMREKHAVPGSDLNTKTKLQDYKITLKKKREGGGGGRPKKKNEWKQNKYTASTT
jgi:hypothetical protein